MGGTVEANGFIGGAVAVAKRVHGGTSGLLDWWAEKWSDGLLG